MYCQECIDHPLKFSLRRLTTREIIFYSSDFLRIRIEMVTSKNRSRNVVDARHMIIHLLKHNTDLNLSLQQIGYEFNKKDHSTIIHGLKEVDNMMQTNPDYKEKLMRLHSHVYGTLKYFKKTYK